jgi:ABC-type glycerol-3-phosphate transport system substrate-binding protein
MAGTAGALSLVACSTPSPAASTPAPAAPTSLPAPAGTGAQPAISTSGAPGWVLPNGNVTVSVWHGTDSTMVDLYKNVLVPNYQKLHPNYTINETAVPDVDNKLLVAVAAGTAPDVFHTNSTNLQNYMERGVLDPMPPQAWGFSTVDELNQKAFIPGSTAGMSYQGKIYGAATQMNASDLFINNRMFHAAGLDPVNDAPKNWDDIVKLNEILTKKDDNGRYTQKGFDWSMTSSTAFSGNVQMLIFQAGGEVLNPDGTPAFNSDAGIRALQVFKSVAVDPRTSSATQLSPIQDFADEQIAMKVTGPNAGPFVEATNPAMKGNMTVMLQPQLNPSKPVTTVTYFAMVVNAKSSEDVRKVAWDFEHWVLTQPALWLKTTGQLQNQADWYKTDEAKQIMPYIAVAIQDMSYSRPNAVTTHGSELAAALHKAAERHLFQDMDPKQSLDQAAEEFRRALQA